MKQKQITERSQNSINSFLDIKLPQEKEHRAQNSFLTQVKKNTETLQHPDNQTKGKKSKVFQRESKSHLGEIEDAYKKATELVSKMNEQRKFLKKKRILMNQKMYNDVQQSLKKITIISEQAQKQRVAKREKIIERMNSRKKVFDLEKEYNVLANRHLAQIRNDSQKKLPILKKYSSPALQKFEHMSLKKYRRSLFLENVEQEEQHRKQEQVLKDRQKYSLKQRQKIFSEKYGIKQKSQHKL